MLDVNEPTEEDLSVFAGIWCFIAVSSTFGSIENELDFCNRKDLIENSYYLAILERFIDLTSA